MPEPEPTQRFDAAAASYDAGRPAYPPELGRWLAEEAGLRAGARALDLGAGTGELTQLLIDREFAVVAAEPSGPMRKVLARRFPALEIRAEQAEALSSADGAFALVAAANSLHWLDPDRAFAEIARVMRSDGMLAVIWNVPDREVASPLQDKLEALRSELPDPPLPDWTRTGDRPGWDDLFELATETSFAFTHTLAGPAVADLVDSWSVVANMSEAERVKIRERVLSWTPEGEVSLPHRAWVSLHRKRPR